MARTHLGRKSPRLGDLGRFRNVQAQAVAQVGLLGRDTAAIPSSVEPENMRMTNRTSRRHVARERRTPSFAGLSPASPKATAAARAASRKTDTRCEVLLRSALHARGLRFRVNVAALPGRPDIVFVRPRLVVFCDGDFWHGRDLDARLEFSDQPARILHRRCVSRPWTFRRRCKRSHLTFCAAWTSSRL